LKTNTECGEGGAGNVKPEKTGTFKIVVDNKTLEWSLVVADLLDCPKNCQLVCPSFS